MNFASQETATDYEGIVHQLQLMAQFLEDLSQKVESEEEGNSVTLLHRKRTGIGGYSDSRFWGQKGNSG
jgi:hypothetical protein